MTKDELLARYDRLQGGGVTDDPTAMAYAEVVDALAAALRAEQEKLAAAENVIREALVTVANGDLRATRSALLSYKPEVGKN